MKNLMILVLAVSAVVSAVERKCAYKNLIEGYTLEDMLAFGDWFDNIHDLKSNCETNVADGSEFIEQFDEKCVKNPLTVKITKKMEKSITQFDIDNCYDDGLNRFLERSKECYSKRPVSDKLVEINTRFVGLVEKLATYENTQQLPIYCCAAQYLDHGVTNLPVQDCDQDYQDELGQELKEIFLSPFKNICNALPSDYIQCINRTLNEAQRGAFLYLINANPPVPTYYHTVLPTLYKVLDNN